MEVAGARSEPCAFRKPAWTSLKTLQPQAASQGRGEGRGHQQAESLRHRLSLLQLALLGRQALPVPAPQLMLMFWQISLSAWQAASVSPTNSKPKRENNISNGFQLSKC